MAGPRANFPQDKRPNVPLQGFPHQFTWPRRPARDRANRKNDDAQVLSMVIGALEKMQSASD